METSIEQPLVASELHRLKHYVVRLGGRRVIFAVPDIDTSLIRKEDIALINPLMLATRNTIKEAIYKYILENGLDGIKNER